MPLFTNAHQNSPFAVRMYAIVHLRFHNVHFKEHLSKNTRHARLGYDKKVL